MKKLLFICGKNRLRSSTAEHIFSQKPGLEVASAGIDRDADEPVSGALLEWADVIFVMESGHLTRLRRRFRQHLKAQRIIRLGIKDEYEYMDPELVEILERKVGAFIGGVMVSCSQVGYVLPHPNE